MAEKEPQFDLERMKTLNKNLVSKIDFKEKDPDPFLDQLRNHIAKGKIYMVDEEDMGKWKASGVAKLKDGSYVVFHDR